MEEGTGRTVKRTDRKEVEESRSVSKSHKSPQLKRGQIATFNRLPTCLS